MASKNTLEQAVKKTIINQGIVPFDQQTPEQQRELIARINSLLDIRIMRSKIMDSWSFVEGSIPVDPKESHLKILKQRLTRMKKMFRNDIIPFIKEGERTLNLCLTASGNGTDEIDNASHFAAEFLKDLHMAPVDKLELIMNVTKEIMEGTFNAVSDEENTNEIMAFGQYCMDQARKGRVKVTPLDFQKFKSK